MSKIYADYDDRYVKNTVVYVKDVNSALIAFKDEACTVEYTSEELFNAYLKGVLITMPEENNIHLTKYYNPIGVQISKMATEIKFQVTTDDPEYSAIAWNPNFEA